MYDRCDPVRCPSMVGEFSCGVVIKEYPDTADENGKNRYKCGYMITGTRSSYSELQQLCRGMKTNESGFEEGQGTGEMISLRNYQEQMILSYHVRNVTLNSNSALTWPDDDYPYTYIGFRRLCGTCPWYWEDGSPVDWTHWQHPDFPSQLEFANCAWSNNEDEGGDLGHSMGQWRNFVCYGSWPGYCEYFPLGHPKPKELPLPTPVKTGGCPDKWWKYGGYCYKLKGFNNNIWDESGYKTYDEAAAMCDSFWSGSTLALLPSPQHNALVASLLGPHSVGAGNGKSPWVGIRNYASSENYFANVDKTRLYYSNWVAGKPNHLEQGIENCVEMKWSPEWSFNGGAEVGQWENRDCEEKRPYLCSHAEDPAIKEYDYNGSKQTWANQTCYDGWIPKSAGCYKFFTEKKSYDDASKFCQNAVDNQVEGAIKGDLVTFWDDYERNHAFSFFRDDSVERRNEVDLPFFGDFGIWVGLDKKRNETWRWIDEWPMTGTHWAPGTCYLIFK